MPTPKKKSTTSQPERRFLDARTDPVLAVEYRDTDEGGREAVISGTAIVFDSLSRDLGGFREIILPTALDSFFARQGDELDVAALWSHSASEVLGRTPRTLSLRKDEKGVHFVLSPPSSRADIVELVLRQDVRGCSFAFLCAKGGDSWEETPEGVVRTISEIETLFEISLVLTPAYAATKVGAAKRSLAAYRRSKTLRKKKTTERKVRVTATLAESLRFLEKRTKADAEIG